MNPFDRAAQRLHGAAKRAPPEPLSETQDPPQKRPKKKRSARDDDDGGTEQDKGPGEEEEEEPVAAPGDRIVVAFDKGSAKQRGARVVSVTRGKKKKKMKTRGGFVYRLAMDDDGEERRTRLTHLKWAKVASESPSSRRRPQDPTRSRYLELLDRGGAKIVAPMVGGSELAFRVLCGRYGAEVAYTPMMHASEFAASREYRATWLQTARNDVPLVAHFCANDPDDLAKACDVAVREHGPRVDAVDLNLGCPQRVAFSGHFGSYLLNDEDRGLVKSLVAAMRRAVPSRVAVCAKIRLLDSRDETQRLVEDLRDAGADVVAVHARKRATWHKRGPGARDGPADLRAVRDVVDALGHTVRIVSNGNVRTRSDVEDALEKTRARGCMSAEGLLNDPALFADPSEKKGDDDTSDGARRLELALEYLELVVEHGNPAGQRSIVFHARRMTARVLEAYDALDALIDAEDVASVRRVLERCRDYVLGKATYAADPSAKRLAADRKKRRDAARSARHRFEERMARKAKREGKPLDFYLKTGADAPTPTKIAELRAMTHDAARLAAWKRDFRQVCYSHYLAPGGCPREETCAFIHPAKTDEVDALISG